MTLPITDRLLSSRLTYGPSPEFLHAVPHLTTAMTDPLPGARVASLKRKEGLARCDRVVVGGWQGNQCRRCCARVYAPSLGAQPPLRNRRIPVRLQSVNGTLLKIPSPDTLEAPMGKRVTVAILATASTGSSLWFGSTLFRGEKRWLESWEIIAQESCVR